MKCYWTGLIVALSFMGKPCLAGEPQPQESSAPAAADRTGQEPTSQNDKPAERPRRLRRGPGFDAGQGPNAGQRPLGGQEAMQDQRGPQRDMGQMVTLMLRQFDADGDEKLDSEELTNMLTTIRQRPGLAGFFQGGRPERAGINPGSDKGGGKPRRPQNDVSDEAGGVTPERPPIKQ